MKIIVDLGSGFGINADMKFAFLLSLLFSICAVNGQGTLTIYNETGAEVFNWSITLAGGNDPRGSLTYLTGGVGPEYVANGGTMVVDFDPAWWSGGEDAVYMTYDTASGPGVFQVVSGNFTAGSYYTSVTEASGNNQYDFTRIAVTPVPEPTNGFFLATSGALLLIYRQSSRGRAANSFWPSFSSWARWVFSSSSVGSGGQWRVTTPEAFAPSGVVVGGASLKNQFRQ